MIKQLQKKFVLSSMLAITILLVTVIGGINVFNAVSSDKQTDKLLSTLAEVENSALTLMLPEVRSSWDIFSAVVTQDDTLGAIYFVVREDVFGKLRTVDTSHISSVSTEEAMQYINQVSKNENGTGNLGRFKYMIMPTVGNLGKTYIFLDVTKQISNVWQVAFLSVGVGVLCWITMFLLTILLSKKAIKPIAANMERQKQFVTDAGHEIKTPLAIIMANTDAMELHYGENKYSKNIKNQVFRLKDLTQDLLALAKMEEDPEKKIIEKFCISVLVEDSISQFEQGMFVKGIKLQKSIQPEVSIVSDKEKVQRLVSILMDNATKYASEKGSIEIYLSIVNKQVQLVIANTAENLEKLEPQKMFDRFYRGDDARTQKSGGYGIGLSAAKAIVEALKGSISVQIKDMKKIFFVIKLPLE